MENIVYHGSERNLDIIISHKSTHQKECIYGTSEKVVSLLFIGKGKGDLDTMIATIDGSLILVERRKGLLNKIYNKSGYLYELEGSSFNHYDYLWSKEMISFEDSLKPLNKIYYDNILDAINEEEKNGNIIVYRYPNRPKNIPLDNSDLIDKYIEFENKGLIGAINDLLEIYPEFTEKVKEEMSKTKKCNF